jgi:hypothetical protein
MADIRFGQTIQNQHSNCHTPAGVYQFTVPDDISGVRLAYYPKNTRTRWGGASLNKVGAR